MPHRASARCVTSASSVLHRRKRVWISGSSSDSITRCPTRRASQGPEMAPVDSYFVTRTMQTLEVLAFQPASATQVADVLRVDARTARRLLNRLTDEGWLTRTDGRARSYTLSLRLVALAAHFAERAPLTRAALPVIDALHARTQAAAHL